jgi:hypothetical protein
MNKPDKFVLLRDLGPELKKGHVFDSFDGLVSGVKVTFDNGMTEIVEFSNKKLFKLKLNKVYVIRHNNVSMLKKHIILGCSAIVTDGSYMVNATTGESVSGIDFVEDTIAMNKKYELFTVTKVNVGFKTNYETFKEVLGVHNNCEITGEDGSQYYCSIINLERYE